MKKLIYVMDPQCGWCYANSNNISELQQRFSTFFDFEILTGGLWLNENAPIGGANLNQFLKMNGPSMTSITGATISNSFYELTKDSNYKFSSLEPSAAIILLKEIFPYMSFLIAKEIQFAMFIDGKRLDRKETYTSILQKLKLETDVFSMLWMSKENIEKTQKEFIRAKQFTNGFPTLILEENGSEKVISSGYFDKERMTQQLQSFI